VAVDVLRQFHRAVSHLIGDVPRLRPAGTKAHVGVPGTSGARQPGWPLQQRHDSSCQSEFIPTHLIRSYTSGEYDHIVAILLSVLLEADELRTHERPASLRSPQIEVALRAIAERSETKAEARVRLNREQRKLNRLGVMLTRTPQELSREILVRLSQERGG
jgi:hypothetical protein